MMLQTSRTLHGAVLIGAALMSGNCFADAKAGEALARNGATAVAPCMQCHGVHGEGQAAAGYPRLAGQNPAYLVKQLQDFKGRRTSPLMQAFAQALNAQQISDVAAYYANLPAWQRNKPLRSVTPDSRGLQLAQQGNWDKGIPACFACHGEQGAGIAPAFPALAGQNATYMTRQLMNWRTGARMNDPQGLMRAVAEKMSTAEIAAVSAYFEDLQ